MNDILLESIRYVKEHFLQNVSIEEIKTAIQEFNPENSEFSENISNKIDILLNEWEEPLLNEKYSFILKNIQK